MHKRLSITAATAALTALPLLAACGGTQGDPAGTSAPSATQAAPSTSSGPASPSPSPTPTFDKAQESKAVVDASEKFGAAVITLSYKDSSQADYLKRMRPLTTDNGYAEVKKSVSKADFDKILKVLKPVDGRAVSGVKGKVKVVSIKPESAETTFALVVTFQQRSGGGWKTLKTSPVETARVDFVQQDGKWLVDHLPNF